MAKVKPEDMRPADWPAELEAIRDVMTRLSALTIESRERVMEYVSDVVKRDGYKDAVFGPEKGES